MIFPCFHPWDAVRQLAEALVGEQARIIVITLQKFPFLIEEIESLPDRT